MNRLLDYIGANLRSEIRLEELAAVADLSVFHFARAFRESVGTTPHQYVLERRIDMAKTLLRSSDWNLEAIASTTGFADASHSPKPFGDKRVQRQRPGNGRFNFRASYIQRG